MALRRAPSRARATAISAAPAWPSLARRALRISPHAPRRPRPTRFAPPLSVVAPLAPLRRAQSSIITPLDRSLSSSGRDHNPRNWPTTAKDRIRCAVVVEPASGAVCMRANTIASYVEANMDVARGKVLSSAASKAELQGDVGGKTGFGPDCVCGEGVEVGAGSTVKRSVIGSHCHIGSGVKLANCVLMDHVTIRDKASLSNTVVCSSAEVCEGAALTNCQVGRSFTVEPNSDHKNATLCHDELMDASG
jgi:translation initiation factor eIF-2B subunit gamma